MNKIIKVAIFVLAIIVISAYFNKDFLLGIRKDIKEEDKSTAESKLFNAAIIPTGDKNADFEKASNILGLANSVSVSTTTVKIGNCVADPSTIKVTYGEKVLFLNNGSSEIELNLSAVGRVSISAGGEEVVKTIDILPNRKPGSMSLSVYTCNEKKAGFIFVTE